MFKKVFQPILTIAIAHLLFILSISPTWAETYSDSIIVKANEKLNDRKAKLILIKDEIEIKVDIHAVKSYLNEFDLNEIELKVELQEELIEDEDGDFHFLDFTFSPPGCYFDKPLELEIKGNSKKKSYSTSLVGTNGKKIGYARKKGLKGPRGKGHKSKKGKKDQSHITEIYNFGEVDDAYYDEYFWAASYFASIFVEKGKGGNIYINPEAKIKIKSKSVDDYLDAMDLDDVEITVEMYYGWDGSIWFVFGPSGTFFTPDELELTISGGYIEEDMILLDEEGEFLEYKADKKQQSLTFLIRHFSSYYYEQYDY